MKNLIKNIMTTVLVEAITLWSVMYAVEEIYICYTEDWIFLVGMLITLGIAKTSVIKSWIKYGKEKNTK